MKVKLTKEQEEFIHQTSSIWNGEWLYMPFWYKKIGDGVYETVTFDNLPKTLKEEIRNSRENLNTSPNDTTP